MGGHLDAGANGSAAKGRRFRFRLATVIRLVAVIALLFALPMHQRYLATEQRAVVEILRKQNAFFSYDKSIKKIKYPLWLEARLDRDYFETVDGVVLAQHKDTDPVLPTVARLPSLHLLKLPACDVTKAGLGSLVGLKRLKWLELAATPTTDEGLRTVGDIRSLEILDLRDTDVTDEGISTLKSMPHLKRLLLGGTRMTPAGIDRLRAELPDCKIDFVTTLRKR